MDGETLSGGAGPPMCGGVLAQVKRIPLDWFLVALLAGAVVAVYGQTLRFEFVSWDDPRHVCDNAFVREGLTLHSIRAAFTTPLTFHWHPVTMLSHMLDVELFGLHAGGHHATNVLLHLLNTILLFFLFRTMSGGPWPSALLAALLLGVSLVIFLVARQRYLQVGWLWYLLTLLPVIGVVQVSVQGRADRYMYLPMVGLLLIVVRTLVGTGAYFSPARRELWRRLAFGLGLASVLALMIVASIQVGHWHDSWTFYTYQVSVVPNDPYFHTNLAYHLYKRGDYNAAIAHCQRALAVSPDLAQAHLVWASVYDDLGDREEAQREERRARRPDLSGPETPTRSAR